MAKRRSVLSLTLADHGEIGSTPPPVLVSHPEKTLAETMTDEEIRDFLYRDIGGVALSHAQFLNSNDARMRRMFEVALQTYLLPDLVYVREINRLPVELEGFNPEVYFSQS